MRRKIVLLAVAAVIALLGTSMVVLYVNGLSSKASANEDLVKVLTATGEISTGESATQAQSEGKFALTKVPRSSVVPGAVTSIDTMGAQVALAPIFPGEQILAVKFGTTAASSQTLPVPRGKVAVSVQLSDPGRVAGFLTPGSNVAIFVTVTDTAGSASASASFTRVLVRSVEVIAVGPTTVLTPSGGGSTSSDSGAVPATILTVALSQRDADRVIFGSNNEALAFGLIGPRTKIKHDSGITARDLLR
jgi:pilus assembly protein CpaB